MQSNYTRNYIKIYFWQGVSLILNFLSMFIVIPFFASDTTAYGIYSICISFAIFLAYADLGFVGSGLKYAAEYFAKGDSKSEFKVIGFTSFILGVLLLLFAVGFIILSQQPTLLVKGIEGGRQQQIASSLFVILAIITTPTTILQRILQMIFGIRMEDYIIQRSNIVGNLLKISAVFLFFKNGVYDIVGYFLFTQIVNLLASLVTLFIAKKRYNYDFKELVYCFRFSDSAFQKTKSLAYASLFLTISWVLYYELDAVAIGGLLGASWVAIYAIGLTVLSFFRSIFGIIYSPINIRFNHFVGLKDEEGLKSFVLNVITTFAPIVIIPILTIALLAKPIVLAWVGRDYLLSVEVVQYLVLCNLFGFISYPIGNLLVAKEQHKQMYFVAAILPVVFWIGIFLSIDFLGVKSFAIFKMISFFISFIVYYYILLHYLHMSFWSSLIRIFKPIALPLLFTVGTTVLIEDYLPTDKSKVNFITMAFITASIVVFAFVLHYFTSSIWRNKIGYVFSKYQKK